MTDYKQKHEHSIRIRTVTNRRGEAEPVELERIRGAIAFAVKGFTDAEGNPLQTNKLESAFHGIARDGMKTSEIQAELAECAKKLFDAKEEPQWLRVAGVLYAVNYVKDTTTARGWGYERFPFTALHLEQKGRYCGTIRLNYTLDELEEAGSWIDPSRDYLFDIAGAELLAKRYLLSEELPQEAFLATALAAAVPSGDRKLEFAKEIYDAVSSKRISLATPVLGNLRTPGGSPTSCFISSMEDSLESIMRTTADVARISKNGGGCGINVTRIRATGSPVGGREGASGGIVPWIKILNDVLVGVNQGGRRAGAGTVSLDVWHADVPEFLELQTEAGDKRRKAYDIFPQLVVPDEFMRRARDDRNWTLCCPYEVKQKLGIDLPPLWGKDFESAYAEVEAAIADGTLKVGKVISAKKLFVKILQTQIETGMPYLWFKDTANEANPNKHDGYIPGGNLCVAPETRILTDEGQIPIVELEGQLVNVWNGFEWSEVMVRKTGENQPLLKVRFSNGVEIECTYYHHFWLQDSCSSKPRRVEARELEPGDKLIKYRLPEVIDAPENADLPYAYTAGFFTGDGSHAAEGLPKLDLYGAKKKLLGKIEVRNKRQGSKWYSRETDAIAVYDDVKQNRIAYKLPLDIPEKFTVPLNGYTVRSRLEWLAGLLDSDGSVYRNGSNESLAITSVKKDFLLEVRLMLQTLGVDSKVGKFLDEGWRSMPDGKGGKKKYFCKTGYRLMISSVGLYRLSELGLKTHRLEWNPRKPQRDAEHFIRVEAIDLTCRRSDTYCFTEPKRNLGVFNGILTGQCQESWSNVDGDRLIHSCDLASVNLANLDSYEELRSACRTAVELLDNIKAIAVSPVKGAKSHNDRYNTIGVGAMGLADWLAVRGLTHRNLSDIDELFEEFAFYCTQRSAELAVERGAYGAFQCSEWSNGNLLGAKSPEWFEENSRYPDRWERLARKISETGIRNSHVTAIAPNTSSSILQGCTASILPVFKRGFFNQGEKSRNPVAPPHLNAETWWYYLENCKLDQRTVVDAVAEMQKWVDTGISMELIFNPNPGVLPFPVDAPHVRDIIFRAWEKGCKAIYYVRTVQKDSVGVDREECSGCAN